MTIKERPIALSPFDVRAIIAGRKTQMRQIMTPQPTVLTQYQYMKGIGFVNLSAQSKQIIRCRQGKVGDRLWVREKWADNFSGHVSHRGILYEATAATDRSHHGYWAKEVSPGNWVDHYDRPFKWKQSLSMPRSVARLVLEITDIRPERLREITEKDAQAEGVEFGGQGPHIDGKRIFASSAFEDLWNEVKGKIAPWESNPWVWVIAFEPVEDLSHG